jgi:ABC-type nitrate/sulfonate/bicarbonate transport system ATPase subunit
MAGIEIRSVGKRYRTATAALVALEGIDLEIGDGELLSILGPSGCGKSTLLYLVAGLEQPSEGEVSVGGTIVSGPGRERNVVFQEYAVFPWRTVLGNVTIGLEGHYPRDEVDARARRFLRLVGLEGFESAYPHQLSGGMKQRTALARSLSIEPQVLLMDEPFAAVDAQTRESLQEELVRIWLESKMTTVFVTHGIEEAVYLAQRVVVMSPSPGRVKAVIAVDEPYPRGYGFRTSERATRLRTELHALLGSEASTRSR